MLAESAIPGDVGADADEHQDQTQEQEGLGARPSLDPHTDVVIAVGREQIVIERLEAIPGSSVSGQQARRWSARFGIALLQGILDASDCLQQAIALQELCNVGGVEPQRFSHQLGVDRVERPHSIDGLVHVDLGQPGQTRNLSRGHPLQLALFLILLA